MKIVISNSSGEPIYQQIKLQVVQAIMAANLLEGDMLPSLRSLAKDLRISVLTVTRAYTELDEDGYVKTIQGKGCFVLGNGTELARGKLIEEVRGHLGQAVELAKQAGLSRDELMEILRVEGNDEN